MVSNNLLTNSSQVTRCLHLATSSNLVTVTNNR